ncbi:MAG: hypothetical protein H0W72_16230 [Planctomycetes bacterium]|nr:hypothetical protein [Planctomycetota bacterium]
MVAHDKQYETRQEWLIKHVQDMLAVEKHIHDEVAQHRQTDHLDDLPEVARAAHAVEQTLGQHVSVLENYLEGIGGRATGTGRFRRAMTNVTGAFTGLFARLREHGASRFLRDGYTALNLAAITYEMLHTTALAHHDRHLAQIAIANLNDLTRLISELGRLMPQAIAREAAELEGGDGGIAGEAEANTVRAWTREPLVT